MAYKPLSQTVTNGKDKEIASSDAVFDAIAAANPFPSQSGNADKILVTNGTAVSWQYAGLGSGSFPTNSIILGKANPAGFTSQQAILLGTGTTGNTATGLNNILIGYNTAPLLTSGASNVVIGNATIIGSTASDVVLIGQGAGQGSTGRSVSIGSGASAGGFGSHAIGYGATDGYWGLAVGYTASSNNQGVALGTSAATGAGSDNTVIGTGAGRSAATSAASNNTIIGRAAGDALTSGASNVFVGKDAGGAVTTGASNVLIGNSAGSAITTGSSNIFLGVNANGTSATSSNEFAVGSSANQINTMFLGRGGADQTAANAVKLMTMRGSGTDSDMTSGSLVLGSALSTGTGYGGAVSLAISNRASSTGSTLNSHVEKVRVNATGEVGIGLVATEAFHTSGSIKTHGDLKFPVLGKGLQIATGSNATAGLVTGLSGAADVTINTTAVKNSGGLTSLIFVQPQNTTNTHGFAISNITDSTSFKVDFSGNYTGDLAWFIINPIIIDSDAQTFINAIGTLSTLEQSAINELVTNLKAASLWSKMDAIYPFVGGTSSSCKFNLKDPQDTNAAYRLTYNGTPTFNSLGMTASRSPANGASTNYNVGSLNLQNLHFSVYVFETPNDGAYNIGVYNGGYILALYSRFNNNAGFEFNGFTPVVTNSKGSGFYLGTSTSTNVTLLADTSNAKFVKTTGAARSNSLVPSTANIQLGGGGSLGIYGAAGQYRFASIGVGLTQDESHNLFKIVESFQAMLGRAV